MTISNDDYMAALKTVSDKDLEIAQTTADALTKLLSPLQDAMKTLTDYRADLPAVGTSSAPGRTNLESAYNQISSYVTQLQYLSTSVNSIVTNYTPASTPAPAATSTPVAPATS